jgi:hypothetical protein
LPFLVDIAPRADFDDIYDDAAFVEDNALVANPEAKRFLALQLFHIVRH